MKLPATSLVESLTASIIFLIAFMTGMTCLVNLSMKKYCLDDFVIIEKEIDLCIKKADKHDENLQTYYYNWGRIVYAKTQDNPVNGISEITITAYLNRQTPIIYKYWKDENF